MKYIVERASSVCHIEKPCSEAHRGTYVFTETATEEEVKFVGKISWRRFGSNHRTLDSGLLARDIDEPYWFVELNSLEELNSFKEKYGRLILGVHKETGLSKITIYDDFIE